MPADRTTALRTSLYPEIDFGGYSRWDGGVAFYTRIAALLTPEARVLDYGCGAGAHLSHASQAARAIQQLKGRVREVVGVDQSSQGECNPWIDKFVLLNNGIAPLESGSFDACYCDWTLEHVVDVDGLFAECARLIRPNGYLFIRTPNRRHYSSIAASLLPGRTHAWVRRWLGQFHTPDDVFPVHYKCNTRRRLSRAFGRHGFANVVYTHRGESHLAGVGRLAGIVGEYVERTAPHVLWHELHGFGRKSAEDAPGSGRAQARVGV